MTAIEVQPSRSFLESLADIGTRTIGLLLLLIASTLVLLPLKNACADDPMSQGREAFQRGAFEEAITHWKSAADLYASHQQTNNLVRARINLATAYQALGQHRLSTAVLDEALALATTSHDRAGIILAKSAFGTSFACLQQTDLAEQHLREALDMARVDGDEKMQSVILNNLANLLLQQGEIESALTMYLDSAAMATMAKDSLSAARAFCNASWTMVRMPSREEGSVLSLGANARAEIAKLDASHGKAMLLLLLGRAFAETAKTESANRDELRKQALETFRQALEIAEGIQNRRLVSYAHGYTAGLYEQEKRYDEALTLTRKAAFLAQQEGAAEAIYLWDWQTGRLLHAQAQKDPAIDAYRRAIRTVRSIRYDLALSHGYGSVGSTFRETMEPLYFELADLLLQRADSTADENKTQADLREARDTIEELKVVELEDYFRDECDDLLRTRVKGLEEISANTAVVYLIPLPDRTEVLMAVGSTLRRHKAGVRGTELTSEVRRFRQKLEKRTTNQYLKEARQLYDWLIRPVLDDLRKRGVDTLVFVPDAALRTIPLAALHDGKQFLIEEFAVAVTPGLSLIDPKPIRHESARALISGLSMPVQGFSTLDYVPTEVQNMGTFYGGDRLLNQDFVLPRLESKLNQESFSVVHIASHGRFGRDAQQTFLLTYESKLTLTQLESMIRPSQFRGRPVELLTLSACQTAAGDDRAALGLAGVAVKAGARSALATLWFVNDQSSVSLISEFYRQLHESPQRTKAEALRQAQLKLLADKRYRHPCYWAPYLLIGNWL